jgi:hypothetical protein
MSHVWMENGKFKEETGGLKYMNLPSGVHSMQQLG